jgi:hypothetical protein
MQVEGRVGEVRGANGVQEPVRLGPYLDVMVSELQGRYFELARYGRVFHSAVKAVTVAATHNSPIAAVTATPVLGLLNPVSSGKAAVLLRISCSTTSGTPAGGQFVLNAIPAIATPPSTSQTGSIFSANVGIGSASPQGSVMRVYNNVALTALAPVVANEVMLVGAAAAAAAAGNGGAGATGEDIGGAIIVPPSTFVAVMAGSGAGTTWIVNAGWSWAEIDWPL